MASRKSKKSAPKRPTKARKAKARANPIKAVRKGAASKKSPPDPNDRREGALALMKKGVSQAAAAKSAGISPQRLARYRRATTSSKIRGRKWLITDHRPAEMYIASGGKLYPVTVPHRAKSAIGRYWNAVNEFSMSNDTSYLAPFSGRAIRDINGNKYVFETGPNTLRMLDAIGELNFTQIYANVAH
jgi:hypothetical protein